MVHIDDDMLCESTETTQIAFSHRGTEHGDATGP